MADAAISMITLLREAKGWNQTDLAREAGVSQAVISRLETGALELTPDRQEALAKALDCPPEILEEQPTVPGLAISCLHHRRRASTMTVRTMRRIEALTHLTRLTMEGLLTGIAPQPQRTLVRDPIDLDGDPREVARRLREYWDLGDGPIRNLVGVVESAGIIVIERPLATPGQDAVSTWPGDQSRFPMMLVTKGLAPDRLRFTVAHELGHLLMHDIPGPEQEDQSNKFAGELLAPADSIRPDLAGLRTGEFRRLLTLKEKWGMSIGALIRRAYDLEIITDRQYREFNMRLGQMGWRNSEPGDVAVEIPSTLTQIINAHKNVRHQSVADIARLAGMTEDGFRRHYLGENPEPENLVPITLGAAT